MSPNSSKARPSSTHAFSLASNARGSGHESVFGTDLQVKVFWPGMGRWYAGKISSYDGRSGRHTIQYKDGDVQKVLLKHEAVLFLDVPRLDGPGTAARLSLSREPDQATLDGAAAAQKQPAPEAEQGSCSTGARKREGAEAQCPPMKRAKMQRRSGRDAHAAKPAESICSEALSQEYCQQQQSQGQEHVQNNRIDSARSARGGGAKIRNEGEGSPSNGHLSTEPAVTHFTANGGAALPSGGVPAQDASAGAPDKGADHVLNMYSNIMNITII